MKIIVLPVQTDVSVQLSRHRARHTALKKIYTTATLSLSSQSHLNTIFELDPEKIARIFKFPIILFFFY